MPDQANPTKAELNLMPSEEAYRIYDGNFLSAITEAQALRTAAPLLARIQELKELLVIASTLARERLTQLNHVSDELSRLCAGQDERSKLARGTGAVPDWYECETIVRKNMPCVGRPDLWTEQVAGEACQAGLAVRDVTRDRIVAHLRSPSVLFTIQGHFAHILKQEGTKENAPDPNQIEEALCMGLAAMAPSLYEFEKG